MQAKVTILILTWNGLDYTRACLESIRRHTPLDDGVDVLVVDNGSSDGTVEYLRGLDWIRHIENPKNLGFVGGNNVGMLAIPEGDILLINNDIVIPQNGWLEELLRVLHSDPAVGIVGARLILPDGRLLHAGTYMPLDTFWGQQIGSLEKDVHQYGLDREVQGVVGACMLIKRAVIDSIGCLDADFFSYFEDTDYCLRAAEAGFRTLCAGNVTLIHHENVSTKVNRVSLSSIFTKSQRIFRRKWEKKMMARYDTTVFWHSQVGSPSGYAMSSRELVLQLDELRVDVRLAYLYGTDWMDNQQDDHRLAAMRQRAKDLSLPQVVYGSGDLFCKNGGAYRIGYTMLEVDRIPDDWVLQANAMDEIWVPSHFNRDTFEQSGVRTPIHVMPLGVNPDYFNPSIRSFRASPRYTFLSVFEWGERKGPEVLLRAYHHAFTQDDDVLLLLKLRNVDPSVNIGEQMRSLGLTGGPPVAILYNQEIPPHQLGSLYRSADCFVLPSRGEGWGLPMIEAMACGIPTIATNWSAQTEFMNESNSYPLRVEKLIPAKAKCPYYEGFRWAQPDEEHLIHLMRHVYNNRDEAATKGERAATEILGQWTWRQAANRMRNRLLAIAEERR
jgi:GT2 family glycosyltransferase